MKWNDEKWTGEGHEVTLVRAAEDGAVVVDGTGRDVKEGDLFIHSGSDTVGVYSVNEDDLRSSGLSPEGGTTTDTEPADDTDNDSDKEPDNDSDDDEKDDHPARKRAVPRKRS